MINFEDITKENIKEHNPNWPEIPDQPYRILSIVDYGLKVFKWFKSFYWILQQYGWYL